MKKLLFVLIAGTFVVASCGKKNPAEAAAAKMCGCPAGKALVEAKKEKTAAAADSAKLATADAKIAKAQEEMKPCQDEINKISSALQGADLEKYKTDYTAAVQKQCPDVVAQ
jgi:hypothetical protein